MGSRLGRRSGANMLTHTSAATQRPRRYRRLWLLLSRYMYVNTLVRRL